MAGSISPTSTWACRTSNARAAPPHRGAATSTPERREPRDSRARRCQHCPRTRVPESRSGVSPNAGTETFAIVAERPIGVAGATTSAKLGAPTSVVTVGRVAQERMLAAHERRLAQAERERVELHDKDKLVHFRSMKAHERSAELHDAIAELLRTTTDPSP